jgi:hypothetical protein
MQYHGGNPHAVITFSCGGMQIRLYEKAKSLDPSNVGITSELTLLMEEGKQARLHQQKEKVPIQKVKWQI